MSATEKLVIVTTGGTIDKIYFDEKSTYQIGQPQVADILNAFNVALELEIVSLMRKDSLEMTDEDRQLIRNTIADHPEQNFVVTHGTDTMVETANALLELSNKTVILTGALNPARFIGSDAVFNVGCAVAAAQTIDRGIFIAMNGRIWDPRKVRKNRAANRFELVTE